MKLISLTRGYSAMVNDEDFEWLNQWKWHACISGNTVYAVRTKRREDGRWVGEKMHRFIMGVTDPKIQVDHIFHDGLDNRRVSLRIATSSKNCKNRVIASNNTSGFKGVSFKRGVDKYIARHCVNGNMLTLGYFDCPKEAARHYNRAAREHGEGFELLNDVEPMFPTIEYANLLTQRANKTAETRARTEKYLSDLANGLYNVKHSGVHFRQLFGKWQVSFNKKYIGLYLTQDEAIEAQNAEMHKTQC